MSCLEPVLGDILQHLADIDDLGDDSLVDLFDLTHQLLCGICVTLFDLHLLNSGSQLLKILFYFFKQPLDVIFDHFKDLWLDNSLEDPLVHRGEVVQRVLYKSDVVHEP